MKSKEIKNTNNEQESINNEIDTIEEKKELSDFRKRFNEGSTVEEAMNRTLEKIRNLKWD